jgi:hypothetical protein
VDGRTFPHSSAFPAVIAGHCGRIFQALHLSRLVAKSVTGKALAEEGRAGAWHLSRSRRVRTRSFASKLSHLGVAILRLERILPFKNSKIGALSYSFSCIPYNKIRKDG